MSAREPWRASLLQWIVGSVALLAATIGPLYWMLGQPRRGMIWCGIAAAGWLAVWRMLPASPQPRERLEPTSLETAIDSS